MAINITVAGRVELTNLNDSKQLQLFINSSQPKTQIYKLDNDEYIPNWESTKPILTPQLFLAGSSVNIISNAKSIKWREDDNISYITSGSEFTLGTNGNSLTINKNILSNDNIVPSFASGEWFGDENNIDADMSVDLSNSYKMNLTINRISQAKMIHIPVTEGKTYNISYGVSTTGVSRIYKDKIYGYIETDSNVLSALSGTFLVDSTYNGYITLAVTSRSIGNFVFENPQIQLGAVAKPFKKSVTDSVKNILCEVIYTDLDTGFDAKVVSSIEFSMLNSGRKGVIGDSGIDGLTAILTNDYHTIPTDENGENGVYTGATTEMALFLGRANNSINWNVKTETSEGLVGVLSGKSYSVTYMPTDVGWVDLIATKTVDIGGASEFVTKRFNLVKNKKGLVGLVGVNGSGAIEYWLTNSVNAIVKDSSGSFNPKTITFNSKSMRGIENPIGYSGRFVIEESVNGTTFATVYTSANDESVKTHTPSANIKLLRVSLYLEGGIVTKLDEQTIPVISDGSIGRVGDNAVSVFVSTPEGSILKNANGTMIAKAELFDGTTSITGSSYRWYRGNSSATSDAGSGWESLTSNTYGITGHTTATLTIPASAIVNIESYKCVVEYNSKKYSDICVVQDITDPYNITIIGANTFKNGQGASTFVARLFQDGTEIDVGNSGKYTYKWYMYDKNDAKVNSWNTVGYKIGKSITVNATESQNQGRLTCEVDVS